MIVARFYDDLQMAEVATRLHCSARTAAAELRAALTSLRTEARVADPRPDVPTNRPVSEQGEPS